MLVLLRGLDVDFGELNGDRLTGVTGDNGPGGGGGGLRHIVPSVTFAFSSRERLVRPCAKSEDFIPRLPFYYTESSQSECK